MRLTEKRKALIAAVRAHAVENYDKGGWDVIVECWDDDQIAEQIGRARTVKGALAKFAPLIDVWADRQAEAAFQIRAAVGETPARVDHFRMDFYGNPACNCGRTPGTTGGGKREALYALACHIAEENGTSKVDYRYYPDGELASATRTWVGKVGSADIDVNCYEGEPTEHYYPGWRGVTIRSEGYCDHDNVIAGASGTCSSCIPF